MTDKTVLILSPHFPPASLAGVHRARHLAKHLPAHGWIPIVLRADERCYTETLDPALAALVPSSVAQVRTGAFPASIARAAGIGDIGLRAWFQFRASITELVRHRKIDVVLVTGSPFYPMLLSKHVSDTLRLPVVLDFQDPWVSVEGATRRRWSKGWAAYKLAVELEPRAVRYADYITSVSDRQNDEMAERYRWMDRSKMSAIPIGGDPEDFDALRSMQLPSPTIRLAPNLKHFLYVGAFLPRAGPLVRALFKALRSILETRPDLPGQLKISFIGTSNQTDGSSKHRILPIAQAEGVESVVDEYPARVPYLEALSLLANASGLLMIGSDEPHYTASKIYPNLMAAKPFLSIFHSASSAHAILAASRGGVALSFRNLSDLEGSLESLKAGLVRMLDHPHSFTKPDHKAYSDFTAYEVSRKFSRIFEFVSANA